MMTTTIMQHNSPNHSRLTHPQRWVFYWLMFGECDRQCSPLTHRHSPKCKPLHPWYHWNTDIWWVVRTDSPPTPKMAFTGHYAPTHRRTVKGEKFCRYNPKQKLFQAPCRPTYAGKKWWAMAVGGTKTTPSGLHEWHWMAVGGTE